ncbi:desmoglein-2-like protein [Neoarius graeffei]|uniref:desmoglein-2-like protein n=1 Tax=Neoarius graeffei TaxID=443677 RepID=UPI00298CBB8D|nr:desmoglein-2-like protein [Neoarius graeffei]
MAMFLTYFLITTFCTTVIWVQADKGELQTLRRQKREWFTPPKKLMENVDYTNQEFIMKIQWGEETRDNLTYSLIGSAVDEGLFTVNPKNGYVRIHGILDREKTATYELKGRVILPEGKLAKKDLNLRIIVEDKNDEDPYFNISFTGSVNELSDKDTSVITVTAYDADEPGTPNSKIAYRIIQQEPARESMFKIERSSGEIKVKMNTLDRETQEMYKLIITGTDMDGHYTDPQNKPRTGTGTVTINILDVNDNIPILEDGSYEGTVEENRMNTKVEMEVRIKATDKDKIHTENWEAVYTIISGNEAGYFDISTDPKTNEGILTVKKELNYEELKEIDLEVVVDNKAPYHKSVVIGERRKYRIKIRVLNVPEAPQFVPAVKIVSISEDSTTIDLNKVITIFTANDTDTQSTATNIRYLKGKDVDNWVSINEKTAEIKLNKYPDYESKFLINGVYYMTILGITNDFPPKTATGTLAIQVQNFNDHCPVLTSSVETLCYGNRELKVTAMDKDKHPNAEAVEFSLVTKENWSIERLNETTVTLRSQEILWPGHYTVALDVQDQEGKSCEVQKLQVAVCTCTEAQVCQHRAQTRSGSRLGTGGILVALLGILLLLLIPLLLLFCECGDATTLDGFKAFPYEQSQQLVIDCTEGKGELKELPLLSQRPIDSSGKFEAQWQTTENWRKYRRESEEQYINHQWHVNQYEGAYVENAIVNGRHSENVTVDTLESMALTETFLGNYFGKKALDIVKQEATANELLRFDDETCNSVTSSLEDLCDYIDDKDDLDFLDDLGPQFKRLAEICCGSAIEFEASSTSMPPKMVSSSSQVGVKVEEAVGGVHSKATSVSASSYSSTMQDTQTTNYRESIISGGTTSATTIGQTLLVQQPPVYVSPTPMYVVEQQHPTLFLASGPVPGVQESNVVLVEKEGTNMVMAAQYTLPRLGLQQAHTKVLVDPGIGGTVVHGFSGHPEPQGTISGTFQVVDSMEPLHVVQSFSHSSINKNQSMKAQGESGGIMAFGNASVIPSALSMSQ